MAKNKLSKTDDMKVKSSREMKIYKHNDMIQKGKHELTLQEQRCVLYAISKIKPNDTVFQEYTFEISDFYKLCGLHKESYTELKAILTKLKQKTWWIETAPNVESTVSWFNKVRTNKKSGSVTIRFDDDMMPYLLELSKQDAFYTHYQLKYILPMKSQYAIRLYELLKSYQRNNYEWFFDIEQLKKQLNCESYKDFKDFRRRVLEPAIDEINKFTDIKITWEPVKKGRKIIRIIFYMINKKKKDLLAAEKAITENLDGPMDILALIEENRNSVKTKFLKEEKD